jgi:hypothetical protein
MTPSPRRNRNAWVLLLAALLAFPSAWAESDAQSGVTGGDDFMSASLDQRYSDPVAGDFTQNSIPQDGW